MNSVSYGSQDSRDSLILGNVVRPVLVFTHKRLLNTSDHICPHPCSQILFGYHLGSQIVRKQKHHGVPMI